MGGCCSSSSSRKLQLHGTPVYYYYQPSADEHPSFLGLNLNMSIPDTYQPPPPPIPYDVVLEKHIRMDFKEAKCTSQMGFLPKKSELELLKTSPLTASATDEEDVCPTCLEEYDLENSKIMTKCKHHFHLSCILEWMERSDTCPVCDQEMIYESPSSDPIRS